MRLLMLPSAFALSLASLLTGQSPVTPLPPPPPPSPSPLSAPGLPSPMNAGATPASMPPTGDDEVSVQFLNVKLPFILLEYEALTGRKIIRDAAIEEVALTIDTTGKMSRAEAAEFIEKSLLLNGYALVPAGGKTYKILAFEGGKQPRTEAPPVYHLEADLPKGEEIVSFVVTLDFLESEEAAKTIAKIIPPHPYGDITPIPNARALVITENSSIIRRILELKKQIDRGPVKVVQRTFVLQRSDAEEVVKTLSEMLGLEDKGDQARSGSAPPPVIPGAPPMPRDNGAPLPAAAATPAATSFSAGDGTATTEAAKPKLHAITRTNRILAVARPEDLDIIATLIKELDAPAEQKNFVTIRLHYLSATEIFPILQDALNRGAKTTGQTGAAALPSTGTDNNDTRSNFTPPSNNGLAGGGMGGAGSGSSSMSLGTPKALGGPKSLLVGKTLVIADPVANELSLSGPPEQIKLIVELVDQLDKRPRQIFLTAVIGQLTLGNDFEFGIDFLRASSSSGGSIRTRNGQNQSLFDIAGIKNVTDALPTAAQGLSLYGRIGNNLNVFLSALDNTNRFKILARPSVFALNNTKAIISTGQRVPIPVSSLSSLTPGVGNNNDINTSVTSNIQYQDVVLRLEVIPRINSNGEVTLDVAQVNDDIVGQTNISGNSIPTIGTQGLTTTVMVADGSSVLLGGLISESVDKGKTGIPILNKIPVIKYLTGSTRDKRNRRELLIFLQPRIVNGPKDLPPNYRDGLGNSPFGAESAAYFHNEQDRAVQERVRVQTKTTATIKEDGKSPVQAKSPRPASKKK